MPIYAYRCSNCGHAQDVLQKMSDAVLTVCPACGQSTYVKQVTAAGFQLKGSGWYVTDFRGGDNKGAKAPESGDAPAASGDTAAAKTSGDADIKAGAPSGEATKKGDNAPAAPSPAPAPPPAAAATSPAPATAPPASGKPGS